MHDESRSEPFATAEIARTSDYFCQLYQYAHREKKSRWFQIPIIAACVVVGFLLLAIENPFGWVCLAAAASIPIEKMIRRFSWLRTQLANVPNDDNRIRIEFFEDSMVFATSVSVSEIDWKAFYKAVHRKDVLLLWPQRQALLMVPESNIRPVLAIETILQKINQKNVARWNS